MSERVKFSERKKSGESNESYISDMKQISSECDFKNVTDP